MVNTTCCTWINTSVETETQLLWITEQATWLRKVTPLMRSFFNLFNLYAKYIAGVQARWIQGIRSGDAVGEDQETIA